MYDGGKIIVGLIIGLGLLVSPFFYDIGQVAKPPDPQLTPKAKEAGACVAPTPYMRSFHMQLLDDWRNTVVRDGDRFYDTAKGTWHLKVADFLGYETESGHKVPEPKVYYKSLQVTCLDCHSNKSKFCDQCHNYVGMVPYCWDCHIEPKENQ